MNTIQRSAARAAARAQGAALRQRLGRRFAHDEHAHGHHAEPKAEPLGTSFWTVAILIPTSYIVYSVSVPGPNGESSHLTKLINKYLDHGAVDAERNAMHTRLVEQAGHDRALFRNSATGSAHFEMRFPEIMGVGSPYAVPAGSKVDISKAIAKYQEQNYKDEAEKLQRLRAGQIEGQEPYKDL